MSSRIEKEQRKSFNLNELSVVPSGSQFHAFSKIEWFYSACKTLYAFIVDDCAKPSIELFVQSNVIFTCSYKILDVSRNRVCRSIVLCIVCPKQLSSMYLQKRTQFPSEYDMSGGNWVLISLNVTTAFSGAILSAGNFFAYREMLSPPR